MLVVDTPRTDELAAGAEEAWRTDEPPTEGATEGTSTDEAMAEDAAWVCAIEVASAEEEGEELTSWPKAEEALCALELARMLVGETTAATLDTLGATTTTAVELAAEVGLAAELAATLVGDEAGADALEPARLAQAKLIFVTGDPRLLGALKSHVMST